MKDPLLRGVQWYWPGSSPLPNARWVVGGAQILSESASLVRALAEGARGPLGLIYLDGGPKEAPAWPWISFPRGRASRVMGRLRPADLVCLDDTQDARALAGAASCPVVWVNGRSSELLALGQVVVASRILAQEVGGGLLLGDPCVEWPLPPPPVEPSFCERFQAVRGAGRWIVYCVDTASGEETLAYNTFLALSARGGGLLALAPRDESRFEPIYRESIKYHLLTVRQRRLITSEVPPKTRVYYIEDTSAREAMASCADLLILGGTFTPDSPIRASSLWAGVPVLVGPHGTDPLVRSAVRAGVVTLCEDAKDLVVQAARLLDDPKQRDQAAEDLRAWLTLQGAARSRFLEFMASGSS